MLAMRSSAVQSFNIQTYCSVRLRVSVNHQEWSDLCEGYRKIRWDHRPSMKLFGKPKALVGRKLYIVLFGKYLWYPSLNIMLSTRFKWHRGMAANYRARMDVFRKNSPAFGLRVVKGCSAHCRLRNRGHDAGVLKLDDSM